MMEAQAPGQGQEAKAGTQQAEKPAPFEDGAEKPAPFEDGAEDKPAPFED